MTDAFGKAGPRVARRARAAGRRTADARRLPAPGRLPRRRDRRDRSRDRQAGARLARGAAADDRARRQRPDRGDVHGLDRRHPAIPVRAQAGQLSRPRSASPPVRQQRRPGTAGSPRPAPRRPGTCSAKSPGRSRLTPGPLRAFFERVRERRGSADRRDGDRAQARRAVLVPAHPRAGLRVRAARDDAQQDPQGRTARRRATAEGPAAGSPAASPRPSLTPSASSSRQAEAAYRRLVNDWRGGRAGEERVRARHRGAHLKGPRRAKPRGRLG